MLTRRSLIVLPLVLGGVAAAGYGWRVLNAPPPSAVYAEDGLAIRGTDPVAYFTDAAPVPGDPAITAGWNGATWRFATAANRDAFVADPVAYAPQYGGWCAWAVATKGQLFTTQPENWKIVDGKLYLNFSDQVQADWNKDIPGFIAEGDRRWPMILAEAQ